MQEHGDAEMGPTKSSHATQYWYSKYGKMKDLKNMITNTKVLHSICNLCFFGDQSFNQSWLSILSYQFQLNITYLNFYRFN